MRDTKSHWGLCSLCNMVGGIFRFVLSQVPH